MKKSLFSKFLGHPTYFLFWLAVGFYAWSFSFYSLNEAPVQGQIQLSSEAQRQMGDMDENTKQTDYEDLNAMSDETVLRELETAPLAPASSPEESKYAIDPDVLMQQGAGDEQPGQQGDGDFSHQQIADTGVKTEFDEAKSCKPERLYYEKQILSSPKLKPWVQMRENESKALPMRCITHVMNTMNLPKSNLAICAKSTGAGRRGGAPLCVTQNMVAVTYNSFVDVTDCLNLNPKDLLPKIANESSFLMNAYGSQGDGGIGQLTGIAIEEVNKVYDKYLTQMALSKKASCARVMRDKSLLTKASDSPSQRCAFMAAPENPLRNIVYMAILNRMNMDQLSGISYIAGEDYFNSSDGAMTPVLNNSNDEFDGMFKRYQIKEKLMKLGVKKPNLHFYKNILAYAGYNMGIPTSLRLFDEYLSKRLGLSKGNDNVYDFNPDADYPRKIMLTAKDFDFNSPVFVKDADGTEKSVVTIARSYIMSSFIGRKDTASVKAAKVRLRKELPRQWANAYLKTFPEYLTLKANGYDGKSLRKYAVYGTPGYLSIVANKNRLLRDLFKESGSDPDYCSNPNFLAPRK